MSKERVAVYRIWNLRNGQRLHCWGDGPDAKWAIGNGPIQYITREQAEAMLKGNAKMEYTTK